ncbi:hypothetical protein HYH02_006069 [Chlamydomonas schloesseri]|uniref:Uncharacterized protein n=1 Tax=Chlamydomonas schloesseri TaxID=2026947 RepID=A0A835WK20_9CHLO|nr:hypothetical protein HYH02_006069 [Chlamydomonas schloesseri]|eukprot:KAG2448713.1 hypothetical protein HYH02_006069 [Chlamydomonas schloesseri]
MFVEGAPGDLLGPSANGPAPPRLYSVTALVQHQRPSQQHHQLTQQHRGVAAGGAATAAGVSGMGHVSTRGGASAAAGSAGTGYQFVHPSTLHAAACHTGAGMGTGGGGGGTHTGASRASMLDTLPSGPTTADLDDEIMESVETDLFESESRLARFGRGSAAAGRSFRQLHSASGGGAAGMSALSSGGGALSMALPGAGPGVGVGGMFLSSGPHPGAPPAYALHHAQVQPRNHQHQHHSQQHQAYATAVAGLVPGFSRLPDLPEQQDSDPGALAAAPPASNGGGEQRLVSVGKLAARAEVVGLKGLNCIAAGRPAAAAAAGGATPPPPPPPPPPGMHRVDSEELVDVPSGPTHPPRASMASALGLVAGAGGVGASTTAAASDSAMVPFTTVHALAGVQSLFTTGGAGSSGTGIIGSSAHCRAPGVSHSAAATMQSCGTSLAGAYHHTHVHVPGPGGRRRNHGAGADQAYAMCLSGSGRCGSGSVSHCQDCAAVTSTGTNACDSGGPFAAVTAAARHPALAASPYSARAAAAEGTAGDTVAAVAAEQHSGSGYVLAADDMAPRALGWSVSMDRAVGVPFVGTNAAAVVCGAAPYVGSFGPTSASSIAAAATPPRTPGGGGGAATAGVGVATGTGTSLVLPGFASGPISGSIAAAAFRSMDAFAAPRSLAAPVAGSGTIGGSAVVDPRLQLPSTHAVGWPAHGGVSSSIAAASAAAAGQAAAPAMPMQFFDNLPDDGGVAMSSNNNSLVRVGHSASTNGGGTRRLADAAAAASQAAAASARDCAAVAGAAGLSHDGEAVAEAVMALLRLDLPCTSPPPPDYESATAGSAATSMAAPGNRAAHGADAGADANEPSDAAAAAYAPELPPPGPVPVMPVPASLLASLEPSGVAAVDRYLQQLLMDPSPERHVFLCKRPLGPGACRAIACFLSLCPGAVKSITLSSCGITCDGLTALCEGLRSCRNLLVLDLSHNALADMGAAALAACLSDMPTLASLTLAGNAELGDAGVAALAMAARGCLGLRRVGLRGTAATTLGMKDLASALASNLRRAAARRGVASPPRGPLAPGGQDRPVTWDGTMGGAGAATADAVFISQLCSLLRTLVQPALPAEQAVAEAVAELLAEAPALLAARQSNSSVAAAPLASVPSVPTAAAAATDRNASSAANSGGSSHGLRALQHLHAAAPTSSDSVGQPAAASAVSGTADGAGSVPLGRFSNSTAVTAAGSGTGDHSASSSAGSGSITTVGGASIATAAGGAATGDSDLLTYLAEGLTARGYDVAVTHALGGGSGGECLRNLRHTFLSVTVPLPPGLMPSGPPSPAAAAVAAASLARSATSASSAAGGGAAGAGTSLAGTLSRRRHSVAYGAVGPAAPPGLPYHPGVIIVDPELREQFEVAMPTPRYEALVAALPRVYVGAEERLPLVVEVLCDELALALRSKGLIIPPWRESSAMISKWQPKLSKLLVPGTPSYAQQMQQQQHGSRRQSRDGGGGGHGNGHGGGSGRSSASVTPRVSLAGGMAVGFGPAAAFGGGGGGAAAAMPVPVMWRTGAPHGGSGTSSRRNSRVTTAAAGSGATANGMASGGGGFEEPSLGPAPALGSLDSERSAVTPRGRGAGAGAGHGNGNGACDSLSGSLRRMDSGGYPGGGCGGGGSSAVGSAVHSFGFRRCTSSSSLLSSSVGLTPTASVATGGAGGGTAAGAGSGVASGGVRAAVNSRLVTGAAAALIGPQALLPGGGVGLAAGGVGVGGGGGFTGGSRVLWVGVGGGGGGLSPVPHSPPTPTARS